MRSNKSSSWNLESEWKNNFAPVAGTNSKMVNHVAKVIAKAGKQAVDNIQNFSEEEEYEIDESAAEFSEDVTLDAEIEEKRRALQNHIRIFGNLSDTAPCMQSGEGLGIQQGSDLNELHDSNYFTNVRVSGSRLFASFESYCDQIKVGFSRSWENFKREGRRFKSPFARENSMQEGENITFYPHIQEVPSNWSDQPEKLVFMKSGWENLKRRIGIHSKELIAEEMLSTDGTAWPSSSSNEPLKKKHSSFKIRCVRVKNTILKAVSFTSCRGNIVTSF